MTWLWFGLALWLTFNAGIVLGAWWASQPRLERE